jgi:hypothetical protein
MTYADIDGGASSLVGLRGEHAHIDDREIGLELLHRVAKSGCVSDFADDLDAVLGEDLRYSFSKEWRVVGDYDPHGISPLIRVPVGPLRISRRPPRASMRSAIPCRPEPWLACAPPIPSSQISTISHSRSRRVLIDALRALACLKTFVRASEATKYAAASIGAGRRSSQIRARPGWGFCWSALAAQPLVRIP